MRITSRFVVVVAVCTAWLAPAPARAQGSLADLVASSRPTDLPGTEQESIVRAVIGRLVTLAELSAAMPPAHQLSMDGGTSGPAHDLAREEIEDDGEV